MVATSRVVAVVSTVQVRVEIEPGDTLRIAPPYMADSMFAGNPPNLVPWHVYWGPGTALVFPDVSRLVELPRYSGLRRHRSGSRWKGVR